MKGRLKKLFLGISTMKEIQTDELIMLIVRNYDSPTITGSKSPEIIKSLKLLI